MFTRLNNLWRLLQALGGSGLSVRDVIRVSQATLAALDRLDEGDTTEHYLGVVVEILTPLAPLTPVEFDDQLLALLIVLGKQDDFLAWIDDRLRLGEDDLPVGDDGEAIPDGALAVQYRLEDADDLPLVVRQRAEELNFAPIIPLLVKYLPVVLQLVREFRRQRAVTA